MMPYSSTNRPRPQPYATVAAAASSSFPFWCHQCRSTVDLSSITPPLACPSCNGEFLEELEFNPNNTPFVTHRRPPPPLPQRSGGDDDDDDDDNEGDQELHRFLDFPGLSSSRNFRRNHNYHERGHNYHEVFERLMHQIDTTDVEFDNVRGPCPAPKASINAIPTVKITESFLADDPHALCAVCKDEFVLGSEAKKLPCNHIYHEDCIIPWLTLHNSCPVCRFQLPASGGGSSGGDRQEGSLQAVRSRRRLRLIRNRPDSDVVEALNMGGMLAQIARRNRVPLPVRSGSGGVTSPQMAEANAGGSVGPANSVETVSSVWHADGGGSGGGGVAGTSAVERADEETDVVMSMDRRGLFD